MALTRKSGFRMLAVTGIATLTALAGTMIGPGTATAAQTHDNGPAAQSSRIGNDISYPQCGTSFPASPAFGIVSVTGGLANDLNPCLGPSKTYPSYTQTELYWAVTVPTGTSSQPKASLYVNTGDPGNIYKGRPVADWPTSGSTPYGACTTTTVTTGTGTYTVGRNNRQCAWEYGSLKAAQDAAWLAAAANAINAQKSAVTVPATAGSYPWWLDVETANSWRPGAYGQGMNVADLQGMIAALKLAGATSFGAYSTSYQWGVITGGTTSSSGSLYKIPDWIPGAKSLSGAKANCALASFTQGRVAITQWTGQVDHDYAC